MPRGALVLLQNCLRLHDNECLTWAHSNRDQVLHLFCFDSSQFGPSAVTRNFNFLRCSRHRVRFLLQAVHDLRTSLRAEGSDLLVVMGNPAEIVKSILEASSRTDCPIDVVLMQSETASEEQLVERKLKEACEASSAELKSLWNSAGLYSPWKLPFDKQSVPDTFTQFRRLVEAGRGDAKQRPLPRPKQFKPWPAGLMAGLDLQAPTEIDLVGPEEAARPVDSRTEFPFSGGESAGLERLRYFLFGTDAVANYKATRNQLTGVDATSKLSPWLAAGCLSARQILSELRRYESERGSNDSTYWLIFELMWRDYFRLVAWRHGDAIFYPGGTRRLDSGTTKAWRRDVAGFDAWRYGNTGVPFVDANMRELLLTGWMSNRGRQNVASFLVKDLGYDWRMGAEWFESLLLDCDVYSNYGNWNYSAGVGNDPRENRKFNVAKQAMDYDTAGDHARKWLPELSKLTGSSIHFPWSLTANALKGVQLGVDYPWPIVKQQEWRPHIARGGGDGGGAKQGPTKRGIDFYFKSSNK